MSWSDGKEHRLYHLARKWDEKWSDQLGSFGLASLDEYDSDSDDENSDSVSKQNRNPILL